MNVQNHSHTGFIRPKSEAPLSHRWDGLLSIPVVLHGFWCLSTVWHYVSCATTQKLKINVKSQQRMTQSVNVGGSGWRNTKFPH